MSGQTNRWRLRRAAVDDLPRLTLLLLAVVALVGCASPPDSMSTTTASDGAAALRLTAELTQDSRDSAATMIAVIVANAGTEPVTPTDVEYADGRLSAPLTGGRLREIPAGGQRRFPLPLVDPVCGGPVDHPGRLRVRVGSEEQQVDVRDEVGVVDRWVQRRCAELEVAALAALEFTEVRVQAGGETAELVLTATPSGEGSGAYIIETVGGTPLFSSIGGPWRPGVSVPATGGPVEVALPARAARCDGHAFGEAAGGTAFLVGVRLDGEQRELLVRMPPQVAAEALDFAVAACQAEAEN